MRSAQMKQIVNLQESDLRELQSLESASEAEVQSQLEHVQFAISVMETSLEKISESPPSDVRRDRQRCTWYNTGNAAESRDLGSVPRPSYKFIPVNVDELLADGQNFIGHLEVECPAGKMSTFKSRLQKHHFFRLIWLSLLFSMWFLY